MGSGEWGKPPSTPYSPTPIPVLPGAPLCRRRISA
jgi:hypothetical protein